MVLQSSFAQLAKRKQMENTGRIFEMVNQFFMFLDYLRGLRFPFLNQLPRTLNFFLFATIFGAFSPMDLNAQEGYFGEIRTQFNIGEKSEADFELPHGFSITTVHGYGFKNWFGLAAGLGILHQSDVARTFSPFFFQASTAPIKKTVSPYGAIDIGYSYQWQKSNWDPSRTEKGGLYLNPAVGIRIGQTSGMNGIISIGYLYQQSSTVFDFSWNGQVNKTVQKHTFRRITFSTSFRF